MNKKLDRKKQKQVHRYVRAIRGCKNSCVYGK